MIAVTSQRPLRDLPIRIGTAILYGAVMLVVLLFGRLTGWAILLAVAATLAVAEFYALSRQTRRLPNEAFGVLATAAMPIAAAVHGISGVTAVVTVLVVSALAWHLAIRQVRIVDTALTVFGAIYVGFSLSHLVLLRAMPSGTTSLPAL